MLEQIYMHIFLSFYQPGRYGYYGVQSHQQSPYAFGSQVNPNYQSHTQQQPASSPYWSFGQGLAEIKHSLRQDDTFGGHRDRNLNSRKHSESRPHDLRNHQRTSDNDYLLVSKTPENDYNPEEILIDQMEVGFNFYKLLISIIDRIIRALMI